LGAFTVIPKEPDFLEAASAWAEATKMGETLGLPADPTWKNFAVFLYCGKIYE
jgi:hypothetical protein